MVGESVILGPYAQWLVRPKELAQGFSDLPFWGLITEVNVLCCNWGEALPPTVTLDGVRYHRFCFMPCERRRGRPVHGYSSDNMMGIQDVREVATKAEIDWFVVAFKQELETIARDLGRPPTLHWGIVGWR
jgi:hypothetical protein